MRYPARTITLTALLAALLISTASCANLLTNGSFETWHSVSGQSWGAIEPDGWHGWEIYPWDPLSGGYVHHITIDRDRNTGVPSPLVKDGAHRASMDEGWRSCYGGLYQEVTGLQPGAYAFSGWAAWLFSGTSAHSAHKMEIIAKDGPHAPGTAPTGTVVWERYSPTSNQQWEYVQGTVQCTTGTITVYANLRSDSADGTSYAHYDGFSLEPAGPFPIAFGNITSLVDANSGTSCVVNWDTNQNTSSNRVYYRKMGDSTYSQVQAEQDPQNVTHHTAAIAGLQLGALYQFHVESGGPGLTTATSSPDQTFETPAQAGVDMHYSFMLVGGGITDYGDDVGPGDDWQNLMLFQHPLFTVSHLGFSAWSECQPTDPGEGPNVYNWTGIDRSLANAIPGKSLTGYYQMWGTSPGWAEQDTPRFWQKFEEFVEAQVIHINQVWGEVDVIFENEPNISRAPDGWHWADWYIHCLQHFYAGFERANAVTGIQNKVIAGNLSGGAAGGFADLYARGLKNMSHLLAIHPYPVNIQDGVKVEDLALMHSIMEQYDDGDKKIFVSEGWGSGRSAGFDRSSPLLEPTAQEIENMWLGLAKGYDNLMTPRDHWDPSYLWGINFFCANDNWGAMGWRSRAIPQKDALGNITGFMVDGYYMTPDVAPYFYNGGMYDFYGNSKDALHLLYPGNGLVFMNPGFELKSEPPRSSAPHFWTAEQELPPAANYSLDDVIYRGGSRSLKLTQTTAGSRGVWQLTAKRSAAPGVTYRARVWCRTEDASGVAGRFYMRFANIDATTKSAQFWATDVTGSSDWTQMEVVATAPSYTSRIEVGCYMAGVGTVWFDDVTISATGQAEFGVVKGYTLDEMQTPVPFSIVTTTTGGYQATSDANGYYEVANVPSGTYDFVCRKPGYVPFRAKNQTVAAGKQSFVMFCMGSPKSGLTVTSVQADRAAAGAGDAIGVSVTVQNTGQYPVNLSDVGLFIEQGAGDATGKFSIHADPYNPRVISASSSAQFAFSVTPRDSAAGLNVAINAYAFGQEDRPNMLTNGGFDESTWNHHWSFTGGASLTWDADTADYYSPPRSLKNTVSASQYTWNWANNYSAYGAPAIPAKPRTNYTIGCYHKDSTSANVSVDLFIQEFYYDGANWLYNGRRFAGVPKRTVWAHDSMIYLTGDPSETPGLYPTNRLVVSVGPCTNDQPASGTTWWDDVYLKETGDWLADDRAPAGAPLAVAQTFASLGEAMKQPAGSAVRIEGLVVTAGSESFTGRTYVESPDRSSGVLLQLSGPVPGRGTQVTVTGIVGAVDGEKALLNASVSGSTTVTVPDALAVCGRQLASALSRGMLMTAWGKVAYVAPGNAYFLLDDGSGYTDSQGRNGLKVWCSGTVSAITPPSTGQFAIVTGISSCEGNGVVVVLRPRNQADVR